MGEVGILGPVDRVELIDFFSRLAGVRRAIRAAVATPPRWASSHAKLFRLLAWSMTPGNRWSSNWHTCFQPWA